MTKTKLHNAFTIVELLVAMTLLVILLGLSGMVFNTTVQAHRAAGATIDVTRNLRAITDQLSTDFRGLRKDAPVFIAFNAFDTDGDLMPDTHYDTIHFFADGDFQTVRQYDYDNDTTSDGVADGIKTVYANVARVYYGHANTPAGINYAATQLLSRKSHLLTVDGQIMRIFDQIPEISNWPVTPLVINYGLFDTSFGLTQIPANTYPDENQLEFNTISLNDWINALNHLDAGLQNNADHFVNYCMSDNTRPIVDLEDINTLHLLLSQGVLQIQIQWAYTVDDLSRTIAIATPIPSVDADYFAGVRWWPSIDPAGDGSVDSDFNTMATQFGVSLELPNGSGFVNWADVVSVNITKRCQTDNGLGANLFFIDDFYPKALKFTFVLRDSNGLFTDGKTFTHIVYIDN